MLNFDHPGHELDKPVDIH